MRRLLCTILGHRPGPKKDVMGMKVAVCLRCGRVVSAISAVALIAL
jgi:hypothetical protein